jgi:hypothetical protein
VSARHDGGSAGRRSVYGVNQLWLCLCVWLNGKRAMERTRCMTPEGVRPAPSEA